MKISIINDDKIMNNKAGDLGTISSVLEIDNLKDFAKVCLKHHICCGTFRNNIRNLEKLEKIWFLQYDFDDGTTVESVIEKLKEYNMVILASKNHMIDKNDGRGIIPRFHVFLPMSEPLDNVKFYSWLIKYLAEKFQLQIDRRAIDSTRYFYKHSKFLYGKANAENIRPGFYYPNYCFHVAKENALNEKKEEFLNKQNEKYGISSYDRLQAAKKLIEEKVGSSISGYGGNNNTYVATCYCVDCGLNTSQIWEVMNWYNDNFCNPKWKKNQLENKIKYATKLVQIKDYYPPQKILKIIGKL